MNQYLIMKKSEVSIKYLEEQSQELNERSKELQERSKQYRKIFHKLIRKSQSNRNTIISNQFNHTLS